MTSSCNTAALIWPLTKSRIPWYSYKEALPRTGGGAIDYARIDAQHGGEYPGHGK